MITGTKWGNLQRSKASRPWPLSLQPLWGDSSGRPERQVLGFRGLGFGVQGLRFGV